MDRPIRILLCSACLALLAEFALLLNWRILSAHIEADAGVITMIWVWPLSWIALVALALLCLMAERMNSGDALGMRSSQIAIGMLMRLVIPVLLLVGPGLILLYAIVMVLMAAGVTAPNA